MNAGSTVQKLLLGTHTSNDELNYLQIAQVRIPNEKNENNGDSETKFGAEGKERRFKIVTEIPHEGEVNRARYMPSHHNVIATSTPSSEIHIYDYFKHPSKPNKGDIPRPELRLVGQAREG